MYKVPPIVCELQSEPGKQYTPEEFRNVWQPPAKIKVFVGSELYKLLTQEQIKKEA